MSKRIITLAVTLAVVGGLAGQSFAANTQAQDSSGPNSPNTSTDSNNSAFSDNLGDVGNDKSFASHNDDSVNDSGNLSAPTSSSFNDSSIRTYDSHDNLSDNQAAIGQVNLNDSYAKDINAADNGSTILDGDVKIGDNYNYGYGYGGDTNVNTGILSDSIQGNYSASFHNVGVGLNNTFAYGSSLNSSQTSNINVLSP